jgi:hypothetical protein
MYIEAVSCESARVAPMFSSPCSWEARSIESAIWAAAAFIWLVSRSI